jgi:hypothetical protein
MKSQTSCANWKKIWIENNVYVLGGSKCTYMKGQRPGEPCLAFASSWNWGDTLTRTFLM